MMLAPPDRPKNLDAEKGMLSSLLKRDVFAVALDEGVNEETFTSLLHKELWRVMRQLDEAKESIDEVSVLQALGDRVEGLGKENIWDVFNAVDTSSSLGVFLSAARESERLRRIQGLAFDLLDRVKLKEDSKNLAEYADKELFSMNAHGSGLVDGLEVEELAWKHILETRERGGKGGHATGLEGLDNMLGGGLRSRTLTVLAARPSMGKTALALQLTAFMMMDRAVYFQSLEMNAGALGQRLISHLSGVPIRVIELSGENKEQRVAIGKARDSLRGSKIRLDDKGGASMALCRAKARRVKDLSLVVIDYCGLVTPSDPRLSREQQIAGISKDAKLLAEELDCPVLLLSQLNRSAEQASREPRLSDLRESGALEQDADNVMLLHQDDVHDREGVTLILAKNRFGETGRMKLKFDREVQTFKKYESRGKQGYRSPFIN